MKRPPSERPSTDPDQCERCGSIWFTRGEFRQYRAGIYTSVPGGELHYESNMAQRVRVCLCGWPVVPSGIATRDSEVRDLRSSIEAARRYLKGLEPEPFFTKLAAAFAPINDVGKLASRLEDLQKALEELKASRPPGRPKKAGTGTESGQLSKLNIKQQKRKKTPRSG